MSQKVFEIKTQVVKKLADTITPVSIYLRIRDKYQNAIMLESSDYHGQENSYSYICFEPNATIELLGTELTMTLPDGNIDRKPLGDRVLVDEVRVFSNYFKHVDLPYKFVTNGLFGYMQYDAVAHFDTIEIQQAEKPQIPKMLYSTYRYVIVVDHFKNELYLIEHNIAGVHEDSQLDTILHVLNNKNIPAYNFQLTGEETSNFTDEAFLEILKKGQEHCFRGDVFQIVLSRRYTNKFKGDDFNVYRALRSVNPSPYLFFFDFGSFKVFGSSPEAQIVIKGEQATIHPIAGTFRRTGNDQSDAALAAQLYDDPKENAEHVMLVDLARNDLSRNAHQVNVETFKEIQYYSHVIHLVSKVTGKLNPDVNRLQLVADTFPAGTLSGAPKYKAMQLIDGLENKNRGFYGGAIGFLGFNGDFNHAILIRSFVSHQNELSYQAGAGVVAKSHIPSELQEVTNKLAALRNALEVAQTL
ncbi:anthranilate synthase component I family protein [Penaeicola halotolerans]|uniref:anthranilate synthase component I family protein n=1 Tax=Penaeicola halotolerans TaxID=2793196 RepID=UPI001CF8737B|nr:anthranilate synthase component I family protein [Penaeicola halotolerans]